MKFLNSKGEVVEGTPLTDKQIQLLERFTETLHEKLCKNSYYGTYSPKPCAEFANDLVPKLDDSAAQSILKALFEPLVEEPETQVEDVDANNI